ncbi:MAG: Xaa-Pro peptidase family protein [Rhodothermales bacterium]
MSDSSRLSTIRRLVRDRGADAALVTFLPDIRWAVGFSGSNGLLVVAEEAAHFVTDGRYSVQARSEVEHATVHVPGYNLLEHVEREGLFGTARTVAVQADHVTVSEFDRLRDRFPGVAFEPVSGFLQELVASKTEEEIHAIRRAQAVTEDVFDALLPQIGPGVSEQDLAAEIVYQHLRRGASAMSFDPIVASGLRGALPHARASSKTLRPGEFVVIDMGCVLEGYASDMTRTVAIGEPDAAMQRAYAVVLDAQRQAVASVRAGASCRAVDAVARDVIANAGLGDYFSHGLGHGVGLQVHEWPRLSHNSDDVLPTNAVVTVEPGVYLPERFGIRIEDMVVARADGPEVLTQTPKDLLIL